MQYSSDRIEEGRATAEVGEKSSDLAWQESKTTKSCQTLHVNSAAEQGEGGEVKLSLQFSALIIIGTAA